MANEISVRTTYNFLSPEGTIYQRDHTYFSDAATTASRPKRYMFVADTNIVSALNFNTIADYRTQLTGPSLLLLVNRDDRVDIVVTLSTASMTEKRTIRPGEWIFIDVCEGDAGAIGGGGSFTYGAEAFTAVTVATEFQSAKGELICIYKAAS